jgi:hypothetical protein
MLTLLSAVVLVIPLGTNLALLHLLWMLVSGGLLPSRGALFPALALKRLPPNAVRRAWAALAYGAWSIDSLLSAWEQQVTEEGHWLAHDYGGYRPLPVDLTGFLRPRLRHCPTRHFHRPAGKALPAVPLGMVGAVGTCGTQRLALPRAFVRPDPHDPSEARLQQLTLETAASLAASDEVLTTDRGFALAQVLQAKPPHFVARLRKNFTARRAQPPAYGGRGRRPTRGEKVRPLPTRYQGRPLAATVPDALFTWQEGTVTVRAELWHDLVLKESRAPQTPFDVVAIHDPRYDEPWLLATDLELSPAALRDLYRDRWAIEQLPLCAKQMLGAERQWVFGAQSRYRLPELALLAGAILSYAAASGEACPTGFWDRAPRATPGRLRRVLGQADFPQDFTFPEQVRKKESVTAHLPKGVLGHRRQAAGSSAATSP